MARLARFVLPGHPHHILQSGSNGLAIFLDDDDRTRFLGWLRDSARECRVAIHAYVLMPDHLHLLATPATEEGLAQMMQRVGRHYVPFYNSKYGRSGTIFAGRFKTSLIDSEKYFMQVSRYIEFNPVRSKLVEDAAEYAWSSYAHHVGVRPHPLVTDHALYWALGNTPFQREAAYQELSRPTLSQKEMEVIDAAVLKGWPLGSEKFNAALQKQATRQVLPAKRGRPAKARQPVPN